jgi:pimeloyl-ACP methyl ester carboxylesterase
MSAHPHIHHDITGDNASEPLLLIEGLGAQMVGWRDGFVDCLVARGFQVVRFDNRDVGLSDLVAGEDQLGPCYTLSDMGGDVLRLLDRLGLASAHIVGQSMGGLISQILAITAPERVRSLSLFYTAPAFSAEFLTDEIIEILAAPPAPLPTRQAKIEDRVMRAHMSASPAYPFDEAWHTKLAEISIERCEREDGVSRQAAAVVTAGDWRESLGTVAMPVAIFHGRADRLVKVEAALDLGRRLATSEVHIYPGMGHEIAKPLWDDFADIIARTARRAGA